jgi:hypothetical protein
MADEQRVVPGAAVDAATTEMGVDRVVVGACDDDVAPVAGVDEVRAGATVEMVDLGRALARWLVVAPQDVRAVAPVDRVGVVPAQELVAGGRARCRVPGSARRRLGPALGGAHRTRRRRGAPARVPVAERWAAALTGPDAESRCHREDEAEVTELAAAPDAWRATAQAPAGLCAPASGWWSPCGRLGAQDPQCSKTPQQEPCSKSRCRRSAAGTLPAGDDPRNPDDTRHAEFTLQSAEPQPDAARGRLWAKTGGWAPGGIARPDEELLLGLARRRGCSVSWRTRCGPRPPIALTRAFRFLKETGPLLAGAGSACCRTGPARPG